MSRGRTASIFIDNGLSSIIKPPVEDNYTANTLFWSPCVKTNKEGIAKIEFKNKNTKDKSIYINIQGVAKEELYSSTVLLKL